MPYDKPWAELLSWTSVVAWGFLRLRFIPKVIAVSHSGKKYGELSASEVRRLRQLEDENASLKRLVADFILDINILQEVLKKKI
jgi:hypothetical protein